MTSKENELNYRRKSLPFTVRNLRKTWHQPKHRRNQTEKSTTQKRKQAEQIRLNRT
jgi:hypothetical protein